MATLPDIPARGEKISDTDFVRWVNRAQAIILTLEALDVPVEVKDTLYHANESLQTAMRRKVGR